MKTKFIALSLLTSLTFGCGAGSENVTGKETPSSQEEKPITSLSYDITLAEPEFINAYIDVSTSMKGYFSKDTDGRFITAISNANPNRLMWMDKNFTEIKGIPTNKLLTGEYRGGDSFFQTMFDRVITRDSLTKSNGISLLFTDGIISASSDDTRKNPKFTPQTLPHFKNEITKALKKRKGIAMVIFMLNSKFDGYYYDYQNKPIKVSIEDRPFYIIAIGKPACIRYFMKNNSINATLAEAFGIYDAKIDNARGTLFVPTRYADWNENKFVGQELGLNLQLPEYIAEMGKEYILENMVVEYNGKDITDILQKDTINNPIKINGKSFTINNWKTMDPKLPLIKPGENTLKFIIKKAKNTSWEYYSSMDDKEIKTNLFEQEKTFALQYLIDGIKNGIEPNELIIFSSEIKFNK